MKNHLKSIALFSVLLLTFTSCSKEWCGIEGNGPIHSQDRSVSNFTGVELQLSTHVNIIYDSVYYVTITTFDNYQSLITTNVHNGVLIIDSKKSLRDNNVNIDVHMPYVDYLNLCGSGNIYTASTFSSSLVKICVSGSGKIDFAGNASTVEAAILGSGDIYLSGTTVNSKLRISGSGTIHGYAMSCQFEDAEIIGSGDIETSVSTNLDATITGSGDVKYLGYPNVSTHIIGSGNVKQQN